MNKFQIKVKEFKKMEGPNEESKNITKYVCFAQCNTLPQGLKEWMNTNPRGQNLNTNVSKSLKRSLEQSANFHNLNRGMVFSIENISYDNKSNTAEFSMSDSNIQGNIDGGHTLKAILEANENNSIDDGKYVFIEFYTGYKNAKETIELAESRNTSVQVDEKSIQELKGSFEHLKIAISNQKFADRISYKMNAFYGEEKKSSIDVREVLAIILMFSQELYPKKDENGLLTTKHPIQCYSGKEATLKKFIDLKKAQRDKMIDNMSSIIPKIFELWDEIECNFTYKSKEANKKYGSRKYSKYNQGLPIEDKSMFYQNELKYFIPKGLMYPLIGAFRALIEIKDDGKYYFKNNPITIWNNIGARLVNSILDEDTVSPDTLCKNNNLWNNLFTQVFVNAYMVN